MEVEITTDPTPTLASPLAAGQDRPTQIVNLEEPI